MSGPGREWEADSLGATGELDLEPALPELEEDWVDEAADAEQPEEPPAIPPFGFQPRTANHIAFRLGEATYAVALERVLELDRMTPITPIPHTPDFVLGVTNLHSEVVAVLDLRRLLGMPPRARLEMSRLIKLRDSSGLITTGAVVDAVQGMRAVPLDRLERPSEGVTTSYSSGEETLEILDVDRLLSSEPVRRLIGV